MGDGDPILERLPVYQRWRSSRHGIKSSPWTFLSETGDFQRAVLWSKLFWPEFVEQDGGVFLAENFTPETYEQWRKELAGDMREIERAMNHVHVYDLFLNSPDNDVDAAVYEYLARVLAQCWTAALKAAFPDRSFDVRSRSADEDYGPTLTFCRDPA